MSRVGAESIKYMVLGDRMRIFENCVRVYLEWMDHEDSCMVEQTCIANCILLLLRQLDEYGETPAGVWDGVDDLSLGHMIVETVKRIHSELETMHHSKQIWEEQMENTRNRIMFLADIITSITREGLKEAVIERTKQELPDLRQLLQGVVKGIQEEGPEQDYQSSIEVSKALIRLIPLYYSPEELKTVYA